MNKKIDSTRWPFWGLVTQDAMSDLGSTGGQALRLSSKEDPSGEFKAVSKVCLRALGALTVIQLEEIAAEMLPHINEHRDATARNLATRMRELEEVRRKEGRKHPGFMEFLLRQAGEDANDHPFSPGQCYLLAWPWLASHECELSCKATYGQPVVLAVLILMDVCRAAKLFRDDAEKKLGSDQHEYKHMVLLIQRRAMQLTHLRHVKATEDELRLEASHDLAGLVRQQVSQRAQKASRASHAGDYAAGDKVSAWMDQNHQRFKGNLNALAREIVAQEVVSLTYAVVRRKLTEWRKLHSARQVDTLRAQ